MTPRTAPALRFWPRVNKTEACWLWTGAMTYSGHGRFYDGARVVQAQRFAWESVHGPAPVGLVVCHACDNPPCVRPDHLFLGTQADNLADMRAKGRAAVGTKHHASKLTEQQVIVMRQEYATGVPRLVDLGAKFGVSMGIVSQIVRGIRYPMVGGPRAPKNAYLGRHLSEAQRRLNDHVAQHGKDGMSREDVA